MSPRAALLSVALLVGVSGPALAAATPEEAQRLTSLFQSYLGSEPGVVTVTPQGDGYAAKLDLAPLFAKVQDQNVSLMLSPLQWTITDQGGGKWKLDQNQSLSFSFGVPGEAITKGTIGNVTSTGMFDEALGTLSSSSAGMTDISADQTVTDKGQTTHITYAIASLSMKSTMQGSPDAVDGTSSYAYTGLKETISIPAAADGSSPAMDVTIASPSGTQDGTMKGLRTKAIGDLAAWIVAHPTKEEMIADQASFKDKVRAALPVFDNVSGNTMMNDVTVGTLVGQFGAKQLGFTAELNGVTAEGKLRETFFVTGLQVPAGLLPAWAAGMVPERFNIDMSVADFNLAAPAALILDKLDLSKPDPLPKDLDNEMVAALLPKGPVTITLGPTGILASLYNIVAEGSMTAGPVAMPSGQATVKMKGLDETMAALQAGPPDVQQMAPMFLLAKGLGKQEPDGSLSWKIESTPTGSVTVNGADISKMLGGQQ